MVCAWAIGGMWFTLTYRKAICTQLHILTDTADDIQINNTEPTTYNVPFSTRVNKGDYHP